ncbi:MAG: tRNA(Ile)(2)-agmatinylcytidine synthase [Methanocorpusculum sp.]|nr:tRNA(Ile)(2)-agmatinylcytidine synthase [Methanocorpusculum sp.]
MFLGIDDTDSPGGMCTTYLGALVAEELASGGCHIQNMRLVRLNPNVPWKTRGNAGISIEFTGDPEFAFRTAETMVEKYAMFDCDNTNPGIVVCDTKPPSGFYYQALRGFCTVEETKARLDAIHARYHGYKNCRGLIGALAAVSAVLPDKTYEYLAYRRPEAFGMRKFEPESFFESAQATAPHTWDTVDFAHRKVVCLPHGKDPVLYGIRGESPEWVMKSASLVRTEPVGRFVVWETNQGTDAHILQYDGEFQEGRSYRFTDVVTAVPVTHPGGHVSVRVGNVDCYAFEPTKWFRGAVRKLLPGDLVTVFGSYQKGVVHVEKFHLEVLARAEKRESPRCPECGGRMTSAGAGKGYKCRECSGRVRTPVYEEREISVDWYEVPADARRHLAKPLVRMREAF